MFQINENIVIADSEIEMQAIRAQGAGGQNVNKVSSAIHLRFDIRASSLPDSWKERLLKLADQRVTADGVIIIKAQAHRSQDMNRADALVRLRELILAATKLVKKRKPTRISKAAKERRLQAKSKRAVIKSTRGKVNHD